MGVYVSSLSVTSQATAPYVIAAVRGSTNSRIKLKAIEIFTLTAPTTSLGLTVARSTAQGTGAFTANVGLPRDPNDDNSTAMLGATWATARPTVGAASTYGRQAVLPASVGAGIIWEWDILESLVIPKSAAATADFCIVQTTATASGDLKITAIWEGV